MGRTPDLLGKLVEFFILMSRAARVVCPCDGARFWKGRDRLRDAESEHVVRTWKDTCNET